MKLKLEIKNKVYEAHFGNPLDIALAVRFDGEQLSAFGAPPAKRDVYKAGDFTGAVSQGGSCNCETYTITPHCNGTHTESVGHITDDPIYICDVLKDSLIPATLVTVTPEKQGVDLVITKESLALNENDFLQALIIRTVPNDDSKLTKNYGDAMPPYFTADAMAYIVEVGVKHLLVDMPSVDRLDDGGKLQNHRIFWGLKPEQTHSELSPKTITELIYVRDEIKDGVYLLNLQVAAFKADAAPSRPVLYEVIKL